MVAIFAWSCCADKEHKISNKNCLKYKIISLLKPLANSPLSEPPPGIIRYWWINEPHLGFLSLLQAAVPDIMTSSNSTGGFLLYKGQGRGALMFSLTCAWTDGWANKRDAGDLRRHGAHYDVTVMIYSESVPILTDVLAPNSSIPPTGIFLLPLRLSNQLQIKHLMQVAS